MPPNIASKGLHKNKFTVAVILLSVPDDVQLAAPMPDVLGVIDEDSKPNGPIN
jgi:hypothetical protein